jgi:NAD(P)-dependent dehydrogenase (short-subunit alcohol dehydrogenase family)
MMDSALITGASRGLGLEFARQYAGEGWRVFACARQPSPALEALGKAHPDVQIYVLDVADHGDISRLAGRLHDEPIDVVINNAGVLGKTSFDDGALRDQSFGQSDYEDWARIFRVNVMGPMKMAEAFIEAVATSRQKKIVTLSSMLGSMTLNTTGGLYGYRASKAAVNAIMKSMAVDLAPRRVIAVALHPGWVRTDMGGRNAAVDIGESVAGMRSVIERLTMADAGCLIGYDGQMMPY